MTTAPTPMRSTRQGQPLRPSLGRQDIQKSWKGFSVCLGRGRSPVWATALNGERNGGMASLAWAWHDGLTDMGNQSPIPTHGTEGELETREERGSGRSRAKGTEDGRPRGQGTWGCCSSPLGLSPSQERPRRVEETAKECRAAAKKRPRKRPRTRPRATQEMAKRVPTQRSQGRYQANGPRRGVGVVVAAAAPPSAPRQARAKDGHKREQERPLPRRRLRQRPLLSLSLSRTLRAMLASGGHRNAFATFLVIYNGQPASPDRGANPRSRRYKEKETRYVMDQAADHRT